MTRNKKIIIALFIIALLSIGVWLSLDSRTKNSLYRATLCKLIYGKNICNFYEMMDIMGYRHPNDADFNKAMQLCRDMENVPKKDGCFEYIAEVISFWDFEKAKQACDEIVGYGLVHYKDRCYQKIQISREEWLEGMVGNIVLYADGGWGAIYERDGRGMEITSLLTQKLQELNLEARCVVSEEDLQKMKEKNKILELVFKRPVDITISQRVEPEEREYRVLEDVGTALFILEDNSDEGLKAHILIGHGTEREDYSCWAIKQEGSNELDKTWIEEIETLLSE